MKFKQSVGVVYAICLANEKIRGVLHEKKKEKREGVTEKENRGLYCRCHAELT